MPARWPISRTPRGRPALQTTLLDIEDDRMARRWRLRRSRRPRHRTRVQALSLGMDVSRAFGARLAKAPTRWIEPPWKAILSNKGILPLLWEMFPDHPNLLPAYFEDDPNAAKLGSILRAQAALFPRRRQCRAGHARASRWWSNKDRTAPRVLFARPWHRCRIFPASIRCSAAGWSTTRPAGYRSARTKIPSPATRRGSCRTRFCVGAVDPTRGTIQALAPLSVAPRQPDGKLDQRAAAATAACGIVAATPARTAGRRSGGKARAAPDRA